MTSAAAPRRRLRIDRLELDLRGVAPETADAAARALGAALAREFAAQDGRIASAERVDAGRIEPSATVGAHELAGSIARRIVGAARGARP